MASALVITTTLLFPWVTAWWLLALLLRRNDIADIAWGLGGVYLAGWFALAGDPDAGAWLVYGLVALWGLRLALHILARSRGRSEDFRYAKWREEWGRWGWLRAYGQVFLLQGAIFLVVALPVPVVASADAVALGPLTWVGVFLFALGFYFEAVGDFQLLRFKSDPANRGRLMTTGLWRYTRHPNYFGEVVLWWGIGLAALGTPPGGWVLVSPLTVTLLLLFVSGIPMLEARYEGRPEWEAYKARTSAFFPLPPRKG